MSVCEFHKDRDGAITEMSKVVEQHTGQWKVLLIVLGVFASLITGVAALQYKKQCELTDIVVKLDRSFASFYSRVSTERDESLRRLSVVESDIEDHEDRLRVLEARK